MSAVDQQIRSLDQLALPEVPFAIITDGDNTMFFDHSDELYPDVQRILDAKNLVHLSLVSADPNEELAKQRAIQLRVDTEKNENFHIPERMRWMKYSLYDKAMRRALSVSGLQEAIVLGDRWFMDALVGKYTGKLVMRRTGVNVTGIFVNRPAAEVHKNPFDRAVLRPIERVGYAGALSLHQAQRIVPSAR